MKHLNKLKLNTLSKLQLKNRELSQIKGGGCTCSCYYANHGGSSPQDNSNANYGLGNGYSPNGCNQYISPAGSGKIGSCPPCNED